LTTTLAQLQPQTTGNMVEEGVSELSPSSSEISLPAQLNTVKHRLSTTLKVA